MAIDVTSVENSRLNRDRADRSLLFPFSVTSYTSLLIPDKKKCYYIYPYLFVLPSLSGGPYHTTTTTSPASTNALAENGQDRARVLCNYDARDPSELSVMQDEVTKFVIQVHTAQQQQHVCNVTKLKGMNRCESKSREVVKVAYKSVQFYIYTHTFFTIFLQIYSDFFCIYLLDCADLRLTLSLNFSKCDYFFIKISKKKVKNIIRHSLKILKIILSLGSHIIVTFKDLFFLDRNVSRLYLYKSLRAFCQCTNHYSSAFIRKQLI